MSTFAFSRPVSTALVLSSLLTACSSRSEDPRTTPPSVRVAQAVPAETAQQSYSGVIAARVQSDLGFRVAGKVAARLVDAGDSVKRGQVLMRLDAQDYALASRQATEQAQAARAAAQQASAEERRLRDLVSAGAVSALAYERAKAEMDSTQARFAALQAQVAMSRNQEGYVVLVADSDGTVMETSGEPGQVVAAGQTVVRLAQQGPREAVVHLPETVRPAIGTQGHAVLFDGRTGTARLRQLSDTADSTTRTYQARFVLSDAAAEAPLGATVSVQLDSNPVAATGLKIPLGALHTSPTGPGVWVLAEQDKVKWRPVHVQALGADTAILSAGLSKGERIVALGAHLLRAGQQVRPMVEDVKQ
ncbi:efflux RND transporter periplasmic adaptor subunit [Xanthomonas euvesicatoria]|uniref:efflux RND transporter periplasmic adaptor subunit n=1 Tax=Xanthomonas euvesicatoria TaxID=456327 RepID=UPI0030C807A6